MDGIDIAVQATGYKNIRYDQEDAAIQAFGKLEWYEF